MKKLIVVCALFLSVGAMAQNADSTKKDITTINGFTNNNLPPLLIVDGVKYKGDIKSIDPKSIEQMEVLKSSSATSIYGAEGLNGVILITTKKNKGSINLLSKPTVAAKSDTAKINPLYIIDGKNSTAAGMQSLNPQDIDNISVLKDASATSIYGPAGKNGVVIIVTKAYKKEHAAKKAETERQGKN
ncbi:TonB-dependent SusC/RagA subfamily outer membrane receptor [Mucilaginibacter sp. UYNi724]